MRVREKNDLEQWFKFFLVGVIETAKNSISTFDSILKLKEDVEIKIYSSNGKVLFRARNYQNNWPNENYSQVKTDPVVYYTISENDEITKKGTITIIQ
jgi:hypothetical protein